MRGLAHTTCKIAELRLEMNGGVPRWVRMIEPDWSDFKVILALGKSGSVTGAARLLGVDHSTVSRRLIAAEEAFGAVLVIRGGREFSFTAEGKAALAVAETMQGLVTSASSTIRAAKQGLEGEVRITCIATIMNELLPFPQRVATAYPNLSIRFVPVHRTVDLAKGEADIAIRLVKPTELDLIGRPGFELGCGVYAAQSYLDRRGTPKNFDELRNHALIQYSENMLHLPWFNWLEQFSDPSKPVTRVDRTEAANVLVSSGAGIGVLVCPYADKQPDFVRVFPQPIHSIQCWFVYHESLRGSARIKAVLDMLVDYTHEQRAVFSGRKA